MDENESLDFPLDGDALDDFFSDDSRDPLDASCVPASGSPSQIVAQTIYRFHSFHALRACLDTLRECAKEARGFATQRIKEIVAEINHKTWSPTSWLYLKDGSIFRAIHRRGTGRKDPILPLTTKSITGCVALTGQPYFTDDAQNDPFFKDTLPSTRAVMSAPLKSPEGAVVGVLTLEAPSPNEFFRSGLESLTRDAAKLVPHVLVLGSLYQDGERRCPWHPRVHKWDLSRILRRVCHAMGEALDADIADGIECVIWTADRSHGLLRVLATTGHGMEYIREQRLKFDTFTGRVAECPVGSYGWCRVEDPFSTIETPTGSPEQGPRLSMPRIHELRALTEVRAVPIHLVESGGDAGEGDYVLSIYARGKEAADVLPSREEMWQIAERLGELFSSFNIQRERLAFSYFRLLLLKEEDPGLSPVLDGYEELFKLKEAKFYIAKETGCDLMEVDEENGEARDLGEDNNSRDYLLDVLSHPGIPVRVNREKSPRPDAFAGRWDGPGHVGAPWADPKKHRFLDVGIGGVGVLRLIRSEESKPFTSDDERFLLRHLALCDGVFRSWQTKANQRIPLRVE